MFVIIAIIGLIFVIVISLKDAFTKTNIYHIKREKQQKKSA